MSSSGGPQGAGHTAGSGDLLPDVRPDPSPAPSEPPDPGPLKAPYWGANDPTWQFEERWWRWVRRGLTARGIPDDATLWVLPPEGSPAIRLQLVWSTPRGPARVRIEDPAVLRPGWAYWPAYHAGALLLRALG